MTLWAIPIAYLASGGIAALCLRKPIIATVDVMAHPIVESGMTRRGALWFVFVFGVITWPLLLAFEFKKFKGKKDNDNDDDDDN